jgi:hypothetical protein
MQRLQQAQVAMSVVDQLALMGINTKPIVKHFLEAISFPNVDQVIPDESPLDQVVAIFKANPDVEEKIMQEVEFRKKELDMQKSVVDAENMRKNIKTMAEVHETISRTENMNADYGNIKANTLLTLEKPCLTASCSRISRTFSSKDISCMIRS